MNKEDLIRELKLSKEYFDRSSQCLEEADADYCPADGVYSARQQVAHIAATVDWFLEGGFGNGFDMDFESHSAVLDRAKSLEEARQWVERSFAKAIETLESKSAEELNQPLAPGPVMGGQPCRDIFWSMIEHTAHHRGALTVYSRLRGHVPAMPYM